MPKLENAQGIASGLIRFVAKRDAKTGRPQGVPNRLYPLISGIKLARVAAGFTQKDMCEAIGRPNARATQIERGEVPITAHQALILCKMFNVTIEQLLEGLPTQIRKSSPRQNHSQAPADTHDLVA